MDQSNIENSLANPALTGRAKEIVSLLSLQAHPEGGYYKEVFKSTADITTKDSRGDRKASTHIYYMLTRGEHSVWHELKSDEIWHFYEGDGLELRLYKQGDKEEQVVKLGRLDNEHIPSHFIPGNVWQTAKPLGEYVLVGCTMAPGFEWEDWKVLPEGCKTPQEIRKTE